MSPAVLSRSISRFRLTKYFPGSDRGIIDALAAELARLASSDAELVELTDRSIEISDGEWRGLGGIYEAVRALKHERRIETEKTVALAKRDEHERTCPGYVVKIDSDWQDVDVQLCGKGWQVATTFLPGSGWINETVCRCRVAEGLTEHKVLLARIEAEKLNERGWTKRQHGVTAMRCAINGDDDGDPIPFE